MPFFGSKKQKEPNKSAQAGAYPTQYGYPQQPSAPPAGAIAPGEQPPPYTPQAAPQYGAGAPPVNQYAPPPPQQYGGQYGGQYSQPAHYPQQPQYGYPPQGMPYGQPYGAVPPHPQIPAGAHVVGHGTFDAGARFNSGASMNIPPPPPGHVPNAAQIAVAYGGTVSMNQGKAGIFTTSSDGGVSTHID